MLILMLLLAQVFDKDNNKQWLIKIQWQRGWKLLRVQPSACRYGGSWGRSSPTDKCMTAHCPSTTKQDSVWIFNNKILLFAWPRLHINREGESQGVSALNSHSHKYLWLIGPAVRPFSVPDVARYWAERTDLGYTSFPSSLHVTWTRKLFLRRRGMCGTMYLDPSVCVCALMYSLSCY